MEPRPPGGSGAAGDPAVAASAQPPARRRLKVDVWSDIACPWCWLGKHNLQKALRRTGTEADIEFHSFELQPGVQPARPVREYLQERYGSLAQVDAAHQRLSELGRRVGIGYDFERAVMANTFDAHRLHHFAKTLERGDAVMERFMRARQAEGADVSDHGTLRRLAMEAGLDAPGVDAVLGSNRFAADVRRDEDVARSLGIRGVPFFVLDERWAVSGAQPVESFEAVIREARA